MWNADTEITNILIDKTRFHSQVSSPTFRAAFLRTMEWSRKAMYRRHSCNVFKAVFFCKISFLMRWTIISKFTLRLEWSKTKYEGGGMIKNRGMNHRGENINQTHKDRQRETRDRQLIRYMTTSTTLVCNGLLLGRVPAAVHRRISVISPQCPTTTTTTTKKATFQSVETGDATLSFFVLNSLSASVSATSHDDFSL